VLFLSRDLCGGEIIQIASPTWTTARGKFTIPMSANQFS